MIRNKKAAKIDRGFYDHERTEKRTFPTSEKMSAICFKSINHQRRLLFNGNKPADQHKCQPRQGKKGKIQTTIKEEIQYKTLNGYKKTKRERERKVIKE